MWLCIRILVSRIHVVVSIWLLLLTAFISAAVLITGQ